MAELILTPEEEALAHKDCPDELLADALRMACVVCDTPLEGLDEGTVDRVKVFAGATGLITLARELLASNGDTITKTITRGNGDEFVFTMTKKA